MPIEDELMALRPTILKLVSIVTRGDDAIVEDLTQDALIQCLKDSSKYDPARGTLKTWAQVVTRQVVLNYMRAAKTNQNNFIVLTETGELGEVEAEAPVLDVEKDEKQIRIEALLHKYIAKLTAPQKQILTLYYIEDKTDREIAQEISSTLDCVTHRRHRAIKRLRGLMAKHVE